MELKKPSLPRPEIDILAYKASDNLLVWVECKSYLDSGGVRIEYFTDPTNINWARYKVFTWPKYKRIVSEELINQVIQSGLVRGRPTLKYCLVAGHIAREYDRSELHDYFHKQGWILYDENWIKQGLDKLAKIGYEDNVSVIVAKLISRVYE